MGEPQTRSAARPARLLSRVIWATLKAFLYGMLIVAITLVAGLGVYGQGTIETGVGEMSRLEAARVYLHLIGQKPAWPCRWGYATGSSASRSRSITARSMPRSSE
jgi:hypothetical protein